MLAFKEKVTIIISQFLHDSAIHFRKELERKTIEQEELVDCVESGENHLLPIIDHLAKNITEFEENIRKR